MKFPYQQTYHEDMNFSILFFLIFHSWSTKKIRNRHHGFCGNHEGKRFIE